MITDRDRQNGPAPDDLAAALEHADKYWVRSDDEWNVAHNAFLDGYRAALRIAEQRRAKEEPVAYLYTLRKPGRWTQYASVDFSERHDGTTDLEWAERIVAPLILRDHGETQ